jgi:hypothetical protein
LPFYYCWYILALIKKSKPTKTTTANLILKDLQLLSFITNLEKVLLHNAPTRHGNNRLNKLTQLLTSDGFLYSYHLSKHPPLLLNPNF